MKTRMESEYRSDLLAFSPKTPAVKKKTSHHYIFLLALPMPDLSQKRPSTKVKIKVLKELMGVDFILISSFSQK